MCLKLLHSVCVGRWIEIQHHKATETLKTKDFFSSIETESKIETISQNVTCLMVKLYHGLLRQYDVKVQGELHRSRGHFR